MADPTPSSKSERRWTEDDFDVSVIVRTLDKLYVEAPGTHPFVMRMQEVNPVDLVEHVLHEAFKQVAE